MRVPEKDTICVYCGTDLEEVKRIKKGHCKDCCCARSWEALGITENTGKSIPEEIVSLRAENERLREVVKAAKEIDEGIRGDYMDAVDPTVLKTWIRHNRISALQTALKKLEEEQWSI